MRFFATTATVLTAFASAVYGLAAPATAVTPPPAVPTVTGAPISGGANPIRQPLGDVVLEVEKPFTIKWYVKVLIFPSPFCEESPDNMGAPVNDGVLGCGQMFAVPAESQMRSVVSRAVSQFTRGLPMQIANNYTFLGIPTTVTRSSSP